MESYFEIRVAMVNNGYLVTFWEDGENDEPVKTENVFEIMGTEHGEIECFQRLLVYITDHFAMAGSKHDKRRIRITTGEEDAEYLR
jgi:hypothetical protein